MWRGPEAPRRSLTTAWVALGANLGDPRRTLTRALTWLAALPRTSLEARSSWHRTAPLYPTEGADRLQPDYLNGVARLSTTLCPWQLLSALQRLEQAAGRRRTAVWGPRTLDLDLLMMGTGGRLRIEDPRLVLPHPRMLERRFVLGPLAETDPRLRLFDGRTVAAHLQALNR